MALSVRISVLMAAAIAASIAVAPAASADPRGGCDQCSGQGGAPNPLSSDFAGLPQGWTNEAQFAKPGNNPFGAGPNPPILALD